VSDKAVPFFFDSTKEVLIELSNGMTFGRNKECDYSVVDHRVSGMHFKVIIKDENVFIVDLESSNKTKLNDDEVTPNTEMKLSRKDKVKFGAQSYYFFFESIDNFIIPDITKTLKISNTLDIVDEMLEDNNRDFSGINLSIATVGDKKESKLSQLKKSKSRVDEYEVNLKKILSDIEKRDIIAKDYDSLMIKIKNSQQELKNANYESRDKLEQDHKSFNFSIDELNSSIQEAQEKINAWKKDIESIQTKIEEVKRVELIFDCLEKDRVLEQELSNQVSSYRTQDLDTKKTDLQKKIKDEYDNYKSLQEDYADSLKYKKNRLAS